MDKKPLINIGGIWEKQGKNGLFFTGKLGMAELVIFKNNHKKTDKQPDWIMYVKEPYKQDSEQLNSKLSGAPKDFIDEDIPF